MMKMKRGPLSSYHIQFNDCCLTTCPPVSFPRPSPIHTNPSGCTQSSREPNLVKFPKSRQLCTTCPISGAILLQHISLSTHNYVPHVQLAARSSSSALLSPPTTVYHVSILHFPQKNFTFIHLFFVLFIIDQLTAILEVR